MLVLPLTIFFFSITLSRTTENNNTLLKNQLQKSLSHINDMLADIEGKIETERKILTQIDYDLNYKDETGFMDYEITDIWWQPTETPPTTQTTQTTQQETSVTTTSDDGDIQTLTAATRIIPTTTSSVATTSTTTETTISTTLTSPIIPKLFSSEPTSIPTNWPFSTTPAVTDTPFIADLKKVMALDRYGHFTTFVTKFLEMLATKDIEIVTPMIGATTTEVRAMLQGRKVKGLGEPLENNVKLVLEMMSMISPATLQQQAGVGHYVLKNKHVLLSKEMNDVFDYYDSLLTEEEGKALFESLELFDKYPDGGKSATVVTQRMLYAMVAPLDRLDGTLEHQKLIRNINEAIQKMYPDWRAHDQVSISNLNSNDNLNHFSQGHYLADDLRDDVDIEREGRALAVRCNMLAHSFAWYTNLVKNTLFKAVSLDLYTANLWVLTPDSKNNSIVPLRRSMDYKKIMRHFLSKHPKLFKKHKRRHHKHIKNRNHHIANKQRHHNFHRRHVKHGHLYEQLLKKRTYTINSNEHGNIKDSDGSEAFYHDPSKDKKRYHKKIKQKKIQRQTINKNLLHPRYRNVKPVQQRQRNYKPRAPIAQKNELNAKYLKELAIKLKKKENAKNFRRLNIESSENEILNESVKVPLVDNNILYRIKEASSYSDEENDLKINLYDAFRHGNRTYYHQFRSNDANNQTLWDVSTESDDEWIIKNNIYKVFE